MEIKKLKRKKNSTTKKTGFWQHCFLCLMKPEDEDDQKLRDWTSINLQPSIRMNSRESIPLTVPTTSSYYLMQELASEKISSNNALLSQAYTAKVENVSIQQSSLGTDPSKNNNREEKDQIVKTILSKYLAIKRDEMLNKPEASIEDQDILKTPKAQNSDLLNIECCSSSTSDTLILDNVSKNKISCPRANVEFPTKSKSAPTNSAAHDSLADICFKMNRFKQHENSDSYVTCCSDETPKDVSKSPSKKKLELIFNPSSDEHFTCMEDTSSTSLQYEICQRTPVAAGTLRTDSLLQKNSENYDYYSPKGAKLAQELYLQPFDKSQMESAKGSASSLKWKLIISHHGRGGKSHTEKDARINDSYLDIPSTKREHEFY